MKVGQNCDGHFVGTKRNYGRLVNIGNVPKYQVNKKKSPVLVGTSTLKDGVGIGIKSKVAEPTVSPIVKHQNGDKSKESGYECNEELEADNIGKVQRKDEKSTCKDDDDAVSKCGKENIDGAKVIKLNIKDIGNDTTSDSLGNVNENSELGLLTPKSC